ncbi:MAG: DUF192 domain-containing protein [Patescibacteria group bacterium]
MISKSTITIIFVAIVFGVILWFSGGSRISDEMPYYLKSVVKETAEVKISGAIFYVELAITDAAREKGLSRRSSLGSGKGMLFIFPTVGRYTFTMQNTLISLDIIWINDNKVVYIAPSAKPGELTIDPKTDANYVLEISGGTAANRGLAVGDAVDITLSHGSDNVLLEES